MMIKDTIFFDGLMQVKLLAQEYISEAKNDNARNELSQCEFNRGIGHGMMLANKMIAEKCGVKI